MKMFSFAILIAALFVLGCGPSDSDFEPDPATVPDIKPVFPGDREAGGGAPMEGAEGSAGAKGSDGLGQLPSKGG